MPLNKKDIIYLDSNATTEIDPAVVEAMMPYLTEFHGNPSSAYRFGNQNAQAVDDARDQVAALIGADPREIIFTSCGTESDNAALNSALLNNPTKKHIITSAVEHSAVIKHCKFLEKQGYQVTWLPVDSNGLITARQVEEAIRPETAAVSLMWANNETGVLFPVEEIAEVCSARKVLFHTDAVQAVGKIPINMKSNKIDTLAISGHKLHCPKGIGVLYVRRKVTFHPFMIGGGQERGKRGGTENVPYIIALGKACELAAQRMEEENTRVKALRDRLEQGLCSSIEGTKVNGGGAPRLPNTSNLAFPGIEAEAALVLLDQNKICASSGSACTTGSLEPSHVLTAMGLTASDARGSLRLSFSVYNTDDEVTKALEIIPQVVARLRAGNPVSA